MKTFIALFLSLALVMFFGGNLIHYNYTHPVSAGDKERSGAQEIYKAPLKYRLFSVFTDNLPAKTIYRDHNREICLTVFRNEAGRQSLDRENKIENGCSFYYPEAQTLYLNGEEIEDLAMALRIAGSYGSLSTVREVGEYLQEVLEYTNRQIEEEFDRVHEDYMEVFMENPFGEKARLAEKEFDAFLEKYWEASERIGSITVTLYTVYGEVGILY